MTYQWKDLSVKMIQIFVCCILLSIVYKIESHLIEILNLVFDSEL